MKKMLLAVMASTLAMPVAAQDTGTVLGPPQFDSYSNRGACQSALAHERNAQRKDPTLVTASAEIQREMVVKQATTVPVSQTERIAGYVDFNQYRVARIGANVTGRVTQLNVTRGETVKAGDLLAQLNSTELGTSQLAYLSADARARLNHRNVERARQLLAADVIGSADLVVSDLLHRLQRPSKRTAGQRRARSPDLAARAQRPPVA